MVSFQVLSMRVVGNQTENMVVIYWVTEWETASNSAHLHCGPFATEDDAWDWIDALKKGGQ